MRFRTGVLAASLVSLLLAACASAPHVDKARVAKVAAPAPCPADPSWDDPTAPRHVYANTWYVGTCSISAILITSDAGHILIDGVTDKAAPQVEANIRALGFEPGDVRYIVSSHEHLDHVGGIARLQRDTGASVVAREPAATALKRGHSDRSDPQFLSVTKFPPVASVQRIGDGETLRLGSIVLTAHASPGHTAGGTSWTWSSCDDSTCRAMVYADSVTPFSDDVYRYSENAGMVAAFRKSLATIADLPCDILLTPHPSASQLLERLDPASGIALVDTNACRAYAATGTGKLDTRIAKELADKDHAGKQRADQARKVWGQGDKQPASSGH